MRIARRINMNLKKQFGYPAKRGPLSAGFTLIELLVVVLIIGILSSVALPQYTKAVNRAKSAEAWTIMKAIADAEEVYFLANDTYSSNLDELDIEIPEMKNWDIGTGVVGTATTFFVNMEGKGSMSEYHMSYYRDLDPSSHTYPRRISCWGDQKNCKNMIPCADIGSNVGAHCYP